jgi:hypothetical protein
LQGFGVGGGEVAGGDGVDLDSLGGPLVGEGLGELGDSAFAGGVGGDANASLKAEEGGDVDDFAAVCAEAAAGDHVAGGELGELKDAGEIDLKDLLPVFEGDLFGGGAENGSGVVDEDVDAAESFFDLGEEIFGAGGGGEIGAKGCGVFADGCGGLRGSAAVAVTGYGGSRLRESDGDGGAEAAGGAGDEGYLVVEAEAFEDVEGLVGHLGKCTGIRVEEQTEERLTMKRWFRMVGVLFEETTICNG